MADFKVQSMTLQTLQGRDESRSGDNPWKLGAHNRDDSWCDHDHYFIAQLLPTTSHPNLQQTA
jgi:hypothetical protein